MKKIFILGSERSGSNLLRILLGNHSMVSAPIALHLCDIYNSRFNKWLPLEKSSLCKIYSDINLLINHRFNEWNIAVDAEEMIDKYNPADFIEIFNSIYSEKAEREKKCVYVSKDNNNHNYASGIKAKYSDALFVYLYRDPRDQVASWMRTPFHLFTPYQAIAVWINDQRTCLKLRDFYGLPMLSVRYEDLSDNTEATMTKILEYLNLPVEKDCFYTKKSNRDAEKHILWKNLNKPVINNNHDKYHDVLMGNELLLVETLAGDLMKRLGYQRNTAGQWRMGNKRMFKLWEKIKIKVAKYKNKKLRLHELKIIIDKNNFINKTF